MMGSEVPAAVPATAPISGRAKRRASASPVDVWEKKMAEAGGLASRKVITQGPVGERGGASGVAIESCLETKLPRPVGGGGGGGVATELFLKCELPSAMLVRLSCVWLVC